MTIIVLCAKELFLLAEEPIPGWKQIFGHQLARGCEDISMIIQRGPVSFLEHRPKRPGHPFTLEFRFPCCIHRNHRCKCHCCGPEVLLFVTDGPEHLHGSAEKMPLLACLLGKARILHHYIVRRRENLEHGELVIVCVQRCIQDDLSYLVIGIQWRQTRYIDKGIHCFMHLMHPDRTILSMWCRTIAYSEIELLCFRCGNNCCLPPGGRTKRPLQMASITDRMGLPASPPHGTLRTMVPGNYA